MSIGTISFKEFNLRLKNIIKNKWQNIDGLMKYDEGQGVKATYFIGVNNGLGLIYSIKDAAYWIKRILSRGFDVGVHGIEYDNYEAMKEEFDKFKEISGLNEFGIRMHYLRTDNITYQYIAQLGYIFDSTTYGMKKHYKIDEFYEFPLQIMDGYEIEKNRKWQSIGVQQAIKNTIEKIEQAKEDGLDYLNILMHPRYFDDSFYSWQIWYKQIVLYCKSKSYDFIDYRTAIKEINEANKVLDVPSSTKKTSQKRIVPKKKVCHLSTVHLRYDVRIFHKECTSLTKNYEVHLIVADGKGDEIKNEIHIHDVGLRQTSRLSRVRIDAKRALQKAQSLQCDLYHFHDPELITIARKLQKNGAKVVYDVHEDLPRQIHGKPYMGKIFKPFVSLIIEFLENRVAKRLDYIFTSTPFIRNRFLKINENTIDINNFPIISENVHPVDFLEKEDSLSYVGGIFKTRGVYELIESLKYSKIKLHLAGTFESDECKLKCQSSEGWKYVEYYGYLNRMEVVELLNKSKIGVVSLYPLRNYLDSLPIKMFEYMLAAIPVIASDFPYWKKIVNENECGLTVSPKDSKAIAEKTLYLISNPKLAAKMGLNGRKAVLERYNWGIEEKKLLDAYKTLLI